MRSQLAVLGALTFALGIAIGAAQALPGIIGSLTAGVRADVRADRDEMPEQDLAVRPALRLVEMPTRAVDLAPLRQLSRHTIGPFNQPGLGLSYIDVHFDRTLPPVEERSEISANGTLRLIIETRQSGSPSRWWLLESATATADSAANLRLEPLSINDQPDEHELARLATDDRSLPILDIQYRSRAYGANSGSDVERHLLVDFRTRVPSVIALLDNVYAFGGGACQAYESIYRTRSEFGCGWDRVRGDFRCAETLHRYDTDWGKRRGSRFFFLESAQPVPTLAKAGVRTLKALAESARSSPPARQAVTVDQFGPSTIIETLAFGPATVVVLGSPMLSELRHERFGVRLHVAVVQEGRETILQEIVPRTSLEYGLKENLDIVPWRGDAPYQPSERFIPDGLVPTFRSRLLVETDRHKILQLTVSEGTARGVYLVGLDFSESRLTADALLVATDAPTHNHCNTWVLPPTSVAMDIRAQPFAAVLDVEPANVEGLDERMEEWRLKPRTEFPTCRAKAVASWQTDNGFTLAVQPPTCVASEPPRRVVIDDQGRLSSSGGLAIERPRR